MVATVKTWSSSINQSVSGSNVGEQYQYEFFTFKEYLKTAGWTVKLSCNSTEAKDDGTDVLSSSAGIIWGTDVSQPISYIVLEAPTNWTSGSAAQVLLLAENPTADTTPDEVEMRITTGAYELDASPLTNRPDLSGSSTETILLERNFGASTTFVPKTMHMWATSDGDVLYMSNRVGNGDIETVVWLTSPQNAEFNVINMFFRHVAGGAFSATGVETVTNWESFYIDGTTAIGPGVLTMGSDFTSWASGLSNASGEIPKTNLDLIYNNGARGSYLGRIPDIKCAAQNAAQGTLDAGDIDLIRYVIVGDFWVPTESNQLPITF